MGIGEYGRDFNRAIGAEVHENNGVVIFDAPIDIAIIMRHDEFVAGIHSFARQKGILIFKILLVIAKRRSFVIDNNAIAGVDAIEILVAIHRPVATGNIGDSTKSQPIHFILESLNI